MRLLNDEFGLWEKGNIVRAFVIGGVVSSSLVYMFLTENVIVFFVALGLIILSAFLFVDLCMVLRGRFHLSHNVLSVIIGFLLPLFIYVNFTVFFQLYFVIMIVLLLLLWFRAYIFKKRRWRRS